MLRKLQTGCCFGLFRTPSVMRVKAEDRGRCHIPEDRCCQMKWVAASQSTRNHAITLSWWWLVFMVHLTRFRITMETSLIVSKMVFLERFNISAKTHPKYRCGLVVPVDCDPSLNEQEEEASCVLTLISLLTASWLRVWGGQPRLLSPSHHNVLEFYAKISPSLSCFCLVFCQSNEKSN